MLFSDFNIADFKEPQELLKKWYELNYKCTYDDNTFKIVKDEFNMIAFKLFDSKLAVMALTFLDKEKIRSS